MSARCAATVLARSALPATRSDAPAIAMGTSVDAAALATPGTRLTASSTLEISAPAGFSTRTVSSGAVRKPMSPVNIRREASTCPAATTISATVTQISMTTSACRNRWRTRSDWCRSRSGLVWSRRVSYSAGMSPDRIPARMVMQADCSRMARSIDRSKSSASGALRWNSPRITSVTQTPSIPPATQAPPTRSEAARTCASGPRRATPGSRSPARGWSIART